MSTNSPGQPEKIRPALVEELLSTAEFIRGYGFRLESLGDGTCSLRLPSNPKHLRPGGVVTGILLLAAADLAMWFAIMTRVGREAADESVTIDIKTNFLRGARGDVVTSARWHGESEHAIYGICEAHDASGNLVAHHVLNYVRPTAAESPLGGNRGGRPPRS
jgi:uncharacterized protein (TIGR00369 family)